MTGPTVERLALDAVARSDVDALARLLADWLGHLTASATAVDDDEPPRHPFRRPSTRRLLPDDHLDVELANFVRDDDGNLHYVDREWTALDGVDFDLVVTRALWSFAHRIVVSGVELPWSPTTTIDELTVALGSLCGFAVGPALVDEWRDAEDALQQLVVGLDPQIGAPNRLSDGRLSRSSFPAVGGVPFTTLRRDIVRLRNEMDALQRAEAEAVARAVTAEKELDTTTTELAEARAQAADLTTALAAASEELGHHRARAAQFERRLVVRVYRRIVGRTPPV